MNRIETSVNETADAVAMQDPVSWKTCVDAEIDQLGWRDATRIEQPGDDVTIYTIDVTPPEDLFSGRRTRNLFPFRLSRRRRNAVGRWGETADRAARNCGLLRLRPRYAW